MGVHLLGRVRQIGLRERVIQQTREPCKTGNMTKPAHVPIRHGLSVEWLDSDHTGTGSRNIASKRFLSDYDRDTYYYVSILQGQRNSIISRYA